MIHIPEGNYYTLTNIALILGKTKQAIWQRAKKMGIKPFTIGILRTNYTENDAQRIIDSYSRDIKLPIDVRL